GPAPPPRRGLRAATPFAATAASAGAKLEVAPLPGVHHVGDHQAERRVDRDAVPVAAADRAGKEDDVLLVVPRLVGRGVLQIVLVPQRLAVGLVLRRDRR